jgi:hypothetical protein
VKIGLMATSRALIDDRRRMITLCRQSGGRGRVFHPFERFGNHHWIAVHGADPEKEVADALFARIFQGGRELSNFDIHRALHDHRLQC